MAGKKEIAIRALDRCNHQIGEIFSRLEEIDDSYMNEKLNADTWSVVQILDHLLVGEQLSLKYLKYKQGQNEQFIRESLKTRLKYSIAMILYSFPVKFKAPKNLSTANNEWTLDGIKQVYLAERLAMRAFIEDQKEEFFTLATSKHPLFGRITLTKMIRFFHKHTAHHEKQILRRLIKLSKR